MSGETGGGLTTEEPLTPSQRDRFTHAADAALRVRRNVLLLAAHASGHMKHPHGESCEKCREKWPCVAVMRAAGPSLDAIADLPSQNVAARLADRDAALARVEALHQPDPTGDWCDHCWTGPDTHGNGPSPEWPCATIRALHPDPSERGGE